MEKEKKLNHKKEENNLNNLNLKELKEIHLIKKFPFLGFSTSLIDYFLIIGYEIPSKNEIASNFLKDQEKVIKPETRAESDKLFSFFDTKFRPMVLNSIGSDFTNAALDEELIIKHMFPNNYINLYYDSIKKEKNERSENIDKKEEKREPHMQNIILYLKANKIYEFDDTHNEKDEQLKNDIMFNVYGLLFYETYIIDETRDKKKYKLFFPKILVFISQYSCFNYFSLLAQNIVANIKNSAFQIPLEI